jgi:ADP-dependent NAD(P)H-hydrate dehydratase
MASASSAIEIDARLLRDWPLPEPGGSADKEERGTTLVVAGSTETPGAAALAAIAALRAGAGKLAVATGVSVAPGLALALPEARVLALPESASGGLFPDGLAKLESLLARVDAVLVGPGLQDSAATRAFTRRLLKRTTRAAVVLDALAMDVILDVRRFERAPLLTPHAGEMAHLTGFAKEEVSADPERHAREAALRWNALVALKGSTTWIATPDGDCWRHVSSQAGLGTSGSGDALAGIIAGLAARGAPLAQAAAWGVALHARAGRALAERLGPIGYLASELAGEIPRLMDKLAH